MNDYSTVPLNDRVTSIRARNDKRSSGNIQNIFLNPGIHLPDGVPSQILTVTFLPPSFLIERIFVTTTLGDLIIHSVQVGMSLELQAPVTLSVRTEWYDGLEAWHVWWGPHVRPTLIIDKHMLGPARPPSTHTCAEGLGCFVLMPLVDLGWGKRVLSRNFDAEINIPLLTSIALHLKRGHTNILSNILLQQFRIS